MSAEIRSLLEISGYNEFFQKQIEKLAIFLIEERPSLDVDGVEVLSVDTACEVINKVKGTSIKPEDIKTYWGFVDLISHVDGVEDPWDYMKRVWNSYRVQRRKTY